MSGLTAAQQARNERDARAYFAQLRRESHHLRVAALRRKGRDFFAAHPELDQRGKN